MKTLMIAILSIVLSVAAQFSLKAGMASTEVKAILTEPLAIRSALVAASHGAHFHTFDGDEFWDVFPTIEDELRYDKVLFKAALLEYADDPRLFVEHVFANTVRFWFQAGTPKITAVIPDSYLC